MSQPENPCFYLVLGFLSRMCESQGLGILVDAYIILKSRERFKNLKLYITGGSTTDDEKFIQQIQKKLRETNVFNDVTIFNEFDQLAPFPK